MLFHGLILRKEKPQRFFAIRERKNISAELTMPMHREQWNDRMFYSIHRTEELEIAVAENRNMICLLLVFHKRVRN